MVRDCPLNGGSPVNTSWASIERAKTSTGPSSTSDAIMAWMSSGASGPSTASGVAAAVNIGSWLKGVNPYSLSRARPNPSMRTFRYEMRARSQHIARLGAKSTMRQSRRLG